MPAQDRAATMQNGLRADRQLLIDGRLVTADRVFASIKPATGEVIGHAPDAGVDEAAAAIAAARRAFDCTSWSTDVELRVRCLDQLHQALLDHADAPFGGFKQSGVGREMGVAGLEEFLERKTFAIAAPGAEGAA